MQYIQCNREQLLKRFTRFIWLLEDNVLAQLELVFQDVWGICDIYGTWFEFDWILSSVRKPHLRVNFWHRRYHVWYKYLKTSLTNSCRNLCTSALCISGSWIDKHITLTPLKPTEASSYMSETSGIFVLNQV